MLDYTTKIKELEKHQQKNDNTVILKGRGADTGLAFYVSDELADEISHLLLVDNNLDAHLWVSGTGKKSAYKSAQKILSKDGIFRYRPVTTTLGATVFQIRIEPFKAKEKLDSDYASEMTALVKKRKDVGDFIYISDSTGKQYNARGCATEEEAKK